MASISSLLRSAQAAQKKVQQQEDEYIAYQWDNSAQTQQDLDAYTEFLNKRTKTAAPGDKLTYQRKITSANRSFNSNEIQRATQDINFGQGTLESKRTKVLELYNRAVANGDMNQAQNLITTYQTIDMQIQQQQQAQRAAAQAMAGQLAKANADSLDDWLVKAEDNLHQLGDIFKTTGVEDFTKAEIPGYKKVGEGFFDAYASAAQQVVGTIDQAIASETDPDNIHKFQNMRNDYVTGDKFTLPGGQKVSLQDIQDQVDAARVGENVFSPIQTQDGTIFERNKKTGFVWGRDANGEYRQIPLYGARVDTKTKINGKDVDYVKLLEDAGINVVKSDEDGILIKNTGNIPGFYGSPFPTGENIRLTVGLDGKLQASDGQKAFNIEFDNKGKLLGLKESQASAINQVDWGLNNSPGEGRFNNNYFAQQLQQDPNYFGRFTSDLTGQSLVGIVDQAQMGRNSITAVNFGNQTGISALPVFTPGNMLQTNAGTPQAQAPLPQLTMPAPLVQPAAKTATVQPALNPFNLPAVPTLKVVNQPAPGPIKVVNTAPTQKITGVTSAPTFTGTLSVR